MLNSKVSEKSTWFLYCSDSFEVYGEERKKQNKKKRGATALVVVT